ncbi:Myosin-binding protein 3 [Striga hermonthica]|uniref:Myosin-binding protein 3 n=1 Tax=Striga hermonthica TaxID=68872 RepID=A0A9N7P112_STRHE|nr:Myosin-binding protein 3 [Striga hermonthica]
MLHRSTNKITLILIYAVPEWILIVLLLLNSIFSYLITKFAQFFGLKPPCPWCTRIDHVFDPAKGDKSMNIDYLCGFHFKEILKLGFCSNHRKLVDSGDICDDCLSSRPEFKESPRYFGLFGKMKRFGNFGCDSEKVGENGEISLNCSCCGVTIVNHDGKVVKLPDFSADLCDNVKALDDNSESILICEFEGNLEITDKREEENGYVSVVEKENDVSEEKLTMIMNDKSVQVCFQEDAPVQISSQHLEFFMDYSGHKLVPIELIDSVTEEHHVKEIEGGDIAEDEEIRVDSEVGGEVKEELLVEIGGQNQSTFLDFYTFEEPKFAKLGSMCVEEDETSQGFHAEGCHFKRGFENYSVFPLTKWPAEEATGVQEHAGAGRDNKTSDFQADNAAREDITLGNKENENDSEDNNEKEADVSIGIKIHDLHITDEIQTQSCGHTCGSLHEDYLTTSSVNLYPDDDHGTAQLEEQMVETQPSSPNIHRDHMTNDQWSLRLGFMRGDKTPTRVLPKLELGYENCDRILVAGLGLGRVDGEKYDHQRVFRTVSSFEGGRVSH